MAKKITFLFCLLTIAIAVVFIWGNKLSIDDSDFLRISSYFQIIGSIATALVIFLMYKQIQLQNYESTADFEPNIHFENMEYECTFAKGGDTGIKHLIEIVTSFTDKKTNRLISGFFVTNNGNNSAFDIKVHWRKKIIYNYFPVFSRQASGQYYIKSLDKETTDYIQFPSFVNSSLTLAKHMIVNSMAEKVSEKSYFLRLEYRDRRKIVFSQNVPVEFIFSKNKELQMEIKFES